MRTGANRSATAPPHPRRIGRLAPVGGRDRILRLVHGRPGGGNRTSLALIAAVALVASFLALPGGANARTPIPDPEPRAATGIFHPFEAAFTGNTPGHIAMVGNMNLTCDPDEGEKCERGQAGSGYLNNQEHVMVEVDVDNDASTSNSSSATLVLNEGEEVLFAGLYWGGMTALPSQDDARFLVRFRQGGGAYRTLAAQQEFREDDERTGAYQGYYDLSADLADISGSTTFTVANVLTEVTSGKYAGWALVVAVSSPSEPVRNLVVYDGFAGLSDIVSLDIPLSGFQTPGGGPVRTKVGYVAWEGDSGLDGDQIWLNRPQSGLETCSDNLSRNSPYCLTDKPDGVNSPENSFNSSMTDPSGQVPREPSYPNNFGVDFDQLPADDILAHGATSATVTLRTNGDEYFPGVVTFATDVFAPKLDVGLVGAPVQPGEVNPGDEIRYEFTVNNSGADVATDTVLTAAVPEGTTYVAGSGLSSTGSRGFRASVQVRAGWGSDLGH